MQEDLQRREDLQLNTQINSLHKHSHTLENTNCSTNKVEQTQFG